MQRLPGAYTPAHPVASALLGVLLIAAAVALLSVLWLL